MEARPELSIQLPMSSHYNCFKDTVIGRLRRFSGFLTSEKKKQGQEGQYSTYCSR